MQSIIKVFTDFALETGFAAFFTQPGAWKYAVMIVVACFLLYLAIVKKIRAFAAASHCIWNALNKPSRCRTV